MDFNTGSLVQPNQLTKERAEFWIAKLISYVNANGFWYSPPLVNVGNDLEVVFEWWYDKRKITLYLKDDSLEYVKISSDKVEDGEIKEENDLFLIWDWLINGNT